MFLGGSPLYKPCWGRGKGAQSPLPPQTPQLHLGTLTRACLLHLISQLGPDGPSCDFQVNALTAISVSLNSDGFTLLAFSSSSIFFLNVFSSNLNLSRTALWFTLNVGAMTWLQWSSYFIFVQNSLNFEEWGGSFLLLGKCEKVFLRYLERVQKSEKNIIECLCSLLLIFWPLLYVHFQLHWLLVCWMILNNLMIMHWNHIARLRSPFSNTNNNTSV